MNSDHNPIQSSPDPDYYVVGGTLKVSDRSYVPRATDQELLDNLINGEYCYVLTTRQMGKSSLMVRTAVKLKEFNIRSAIIDLTSIGTSVGLEAWYLGQIRRIVRQLRLHFDYESWWRENASFSEVDRYSMFISEILLEKVSSSVVLFIDEIDSTLSLSYTDDFFAAIRSLYNERAINSELERLTFVLLGVASPSDLVKAVERTPFNIGRRIELNDFTLEEAKPLAAGLAPGSEQAFKLLQQIINWTGGHPYLTQKTCQVVAQWAKESWDTTQVDKIVEKLVLATFLTKRGKQTDDNLHFVRERLLRESQSAELLKLYSLIIKDIIIINKERNLTHARLKLIGIVKANDLGILEVRNRIYSEVFNITWLNNNGVTIDDNSTGSQISDKFNTNYVHQNISKYDNNKVTETIIQSGSSNNTINIYYDSSTIIASDSLLTRQDYRNRQALLAKVKNYWVKGVLEESLYHQVLIEQGLEQRPDALANPLSQIIEIGDSSPQLLPEGTKVINIFDQISPGRTLLILGEPGSGKTTTLLELTRDLIARAEQDIAYQIPVVLNLSSWAYKNQNIATWLVEELNTKYDVPNQIGQALVIQQQLLLLLDGLDEVKADYRDDCIIALNTFSKQYGAEIVVCSRIKDYQALSNRLNFTSAVYLRLLTLEQIYHYLDSLGANVTGLRALITKDRVLQKLAQSPLMLNIMTLAYQGVAVEDLPKTDLLEERRKQLFSAYIDSMFKRRRTNQRYSKAQTKYWLAWLAKRMVENQQRIFLIERMQPTWLLNRTQRIVYSTLLKLVCGLIFGLTGGLIVFSFTGVLIYGLTGGLIFSLTGGLVFSSLLGLGSTQEIKPVETLDWSRTLENAINFNEIIKGIGRLIVGLSVGLAFIPVFGLFFGLFFGLVFGLIGGLIGSNIELKAAPNQGIFRFISAVKAAPNQGIFRSAVNARTLGLLSVWIFGWMGYLIAGLSTRLITGLITILLMSMLSNAGIACIQHFVLRIILFCSGYIPWNYARFLDYATDRIFLQKVGGGYMFVHRVLLEHFATLEPWELE
ncbi:MAG: NACHT domain-containing protein [Moorea sp. SIO3I7]|uniref:AAA-like domain-containing protein n=1 Tax=Moorena sp. SIO3I8 TaxID=2607833 RepID=UPI0013C10F8D|nr:AAA-like domain-containing protein [Moorena sp. SIO3I8]NEN97191.1 NACHT domain-containing protein [Moorena sp. SIO3I7]NEO09077.1 NACHT domain-containing protein [Moorena sp. SIO3I8]